MARAKKTTLSKSVTHLVYNTPTKGIAFIGDPHVWSHKPGRRRDTDYLGTILNKIIWIAEYCNTNHLLPVILGDLLDDSQDNDLVMISRLVAALQHFQRKPLVLVGNHDLSEKTLTPGTVLHLLHHTGQIDAMIKNGPHATITLENDDGEEHLLIGGTPYGESIPTSLRAWAGTNTEATHEQMKEEMGVHKVIWITHDDLAFDSSYPNSIALHPILGVDISVNGHMHRTQKPLQKGNTSWYNPGNINRLSIDLIDQAPKIWVYHANQTSTETGGDGLPVALIEGIEVPHVPGPDILSLEGRISSVEQHTQVKISDGESEQPSDTLLSAFVQQMKEDVSVARSDDGVFLAGAITEEFEHVKPPEHVRNIVSRLFERAMLQHRGQL